MFILRGILTESFKLLTEMAPWLLVGFLFAGLIYVFLPKERIIRHLGKANIMSVFKAALVGIPLPLCSCGVIPVVTSLRKQGASKGACLSFLTSTPTSGVDSIFATYSLLGLLFAIYRVIASFVTGLFSGFIANVLEKGNTAENVELTQICNICDNTTPHMHTFGDKVKIMFYYGFGELIEDTGKWIIIGILIGGLIIYFIPEGFIQNYFGAGFLSMLVMLVVGIPIYVCATGSIPIAAALMLKGLSPGGALVFLIAGPATNAVTITVISKYMGKKMTVLYLLSIAMASILLALLFNVMWGNLEISKVVMQGRMLPTLVKIISSLILLGLILYSARGSIKRLFVRRAH
ncbi:MAG TPA: permease [bacterium (Candidatus Stahlbacteria)]|nr:permease [Candidatus Stahlbacteria bacterium]